MTATMPTSIPAYNYGLYPPQNGVNGYSKSVCGFRKRCERIDWRKIAAIDVDIIAQTLDFTALQENLMNITFCNIESELDMRMVDPNFVKLFKLSQIIIEYLLNSQEYLASVILDAEDKLKKVTESNDANKKALEATQCELTSVKKESHKRKKLLTAQQQLITSASVSSNKCPYCPKSFITPGFLQSHMDKRHAHAESKSPPPRGVSQPSLSATLQRELADIKERLRLTETHLLSDQPKRSTSPVKWVEENKENEPTQVRTTRSPGHHQEKNREVERMQELYMKELRELREKYEVSQTILQEIQESHYAKKSNLGTLRDDVDVDELVAAQKDELSRLQDNLVTQMEVKLKKQDQRWQRRMQAMTVKHKEEMDKVIRDVSENNVPAQEISRIQTLENEKDAESKKRAKAAQHRSAVKQILQQKTKPVKEAPIQPVHHGVTTGGVMTGAVTLPDANAVTDILSDETESEDEAVPKTTPLSSLKSSGEVSSRSGGRSLSRLKNDPNIIKGMRDEVQSLLDAKLESLGVSPHARALNTKLLDVKLALLRNERKGKEQRFVEFKELRQKINRTVGDLAKEKAKSLKKSPASPRTKVITSPASTPGRSPTRSIQGPESPRRPPRPAPRTATATPQQSILRRSLRSTGSTTEWGSSQWDSEDESESDDEDNSDLRRRKTGVVDIAGSPTHKPTPVARVKTPPRVTADDWDSDDVSDLQEVVPTAGNRPRAPSPRGVNVAQRSRELELKLSSREDKKPPGGVDTMKTKASPSTAYQNSNDNDEFSDISSIEEDVYATPLKRPTTGVNRQSYGETDASSNTYGTSKWGSSKAPSTVAGSHTTAANDDWDSDSSAI